jgi:hypothetical protein
VRSVPPSLVGNGRVGLEIRGGHSSVHAPFGGALFLGMGNKKPRLGGRGFKVKQPKEKLPTRRFAAGAGRLSCAPPAV